MKKSFLCVLLVFGISAMGFSQDETERFPINIWFSAGPSFGNYFMNGKDLENSYTGSPGVNLNFYALFGEKNMGIFFNYGIMFPVVNSTRENYEPSVQLDFILLGFGFGYDINESLMLHFGIGPNMNMLFLHSDTNSGDYFIGLGLGGDIGLTFNPIKFLCINVGTTLSYNFSAYREIRNNIDFRNNKYDIVESGWVNHYSMIGIKPYITIGFNYYH